MHNILSVCMIVKNEEKVLNRCLDSIVNIADEIIIVDTGSVDRTKEIALEYTEDLYEFNWIGDFSKARNFAASKAKGKWILALDADEYVDRQSFTELKEMLQNKPPENNIIALRIVNFVGTNGNKISLNYHERLYKNNSFISYHRSIHEMLNHKDPSKAKRGLLDFQIYHSGYITEIFKEKNKTQRNMELLLNKDNIEAVDYFFLGNEYRNIEEHDKAILSYQKAYKLTSDYNLDWVMKLFLYLTETLHKVGNDAEALEILTACEELYPRIVDYKYFKAVIYFNQQKYVMSKKIFEDILLQKNIYIAEESPDFLELLPHKYLGEIYEIEKDLQNAVKHYSKAISLNNTDDELWKRLLHLLADNTTLEELINFLNNNLVNIPNMKPERIVKILLSVPVLEVQKLSRSYVNNKELSKAENEALILKNIFLDKGYSETVKIIESNSSDGLVSILTTGIFSLVDLILLTIITENKIFKEFLYNINYDLPMESLFNMIFLKKNNKLNKIEENFYISLIIQSIVLETEEVTYNLKGKRKILSKELQERLDNALIKKR